MESIINLIPKGKENAIKRDDLINKCMQYDLIDRNLSFSAAYRALRVLLEKEKEKNPILNCQDGCGYFRPTSKDLNDVRRYILQEESRARQINKGLIPVRIFCFNAERGKVLDE